MVKNTAALIGCGLAICPKSSIDPNNDWPYYVCSKYLVTEKQIQIFCFLFKITSLGMWNLELIWFLVFISIDKIYRQLGDNKPYTLVDTSKSINEQLYGLNL
jgi:hypothetical protein